jgi:hypothetical protein
MRINKISTIVAALLAGTALAGAQQPPRQERPIQRHGEFGCPVCGSPCINKASLQRQLHQRRFQQQGARQFHGNNQPDPANRQWQGYRENASLRTEQRGRQQGVGRFDFDGDGQLSSAERAARRAYRDALNQQQDVQPNARSSVQPPVE